MIFIIFGYLNLSSVSHNEYYLDDLSKFHNQIGEVIVDDYYYKNQFLYSGKFVNFEEWNRKFFVKDFGISLRKVVSDALSKKKGTQSGLIPDIDIDLKLPRGLSYFIGEGGHISVDGSQSISLDLSRSQSSSIIRKTSAFPQIKLEQRLRANIHGTVGEKIHVKINHDSEAREKDNKLKIWYEGDEDDIIQNIDAGDLKELGGGRNQSVFGIQTSGAVGNTKFNVTAGKIESNTSSKTESISLSKDSVEHNEKDFVRNEYYYTGLTEGDSLIAIGLFIESDKVNGVKLRLVDINGNHLASTWFRELKFEDEYEVRYLRIIGGGLIPYLRIRSWYGNSKIGMWYIYYNGTIGELDTLGYLPSEAGDTLTIAQLRPRDPDPNDASWNLMMRNIYRFGTLSPDRVNVKILKVITGGDDIEIDPVSDREYVEFLGIDADGNGITDPTQVIWSDGCIIFPNAKPFINPTLGADTVPVIYNKRFNSLSPGEGENYRIVITSSSSKQEFYMGYDMVDSSEVIVVDGTDTLRRGSDYKVDYSTGRVVFTENANISPDSKLSYTYDTEPLFSFTSRYIAKTEIRTEPFEDSKLDVNLQFRSSSNPEPHPRIGVEPSHITLGKILFSADRDLEILSNLPFVNPEINSKVRINGSYGFSLPNPATNGKSYLDDMESVKLSRGLELSAVLWNYCSQPDDLTSYDALGKIDWFNSRIPRSYISPELPQELRSQYTGTMILYFRPDTSLSNIYNSWAGIMKTFPSSENFSKKKYLEIWVKGDEGKLYIELGSKMKEDIARWGRGSDGSDSLLLPNGIIDTEDRNGNFQLEPNEDTGLDGIAFDDDKWSYNKDSLDDGRDDYPDRLITFQDSIRLHRKEGNRRLDSEDINRDYSLEKNDEFFRYSIDLESDELVVNSGLYGWKLYRIPMRDQKYYEEFGAPSFENILYARIWFTGVNKTTRVSIAEVAMVGNKWLDKGIRDFQTNTIDTTGGKFLITYRNSFEDEDYIPPVEQEREVYGGFAKEQSLVFRIDSLINGDFCLAETYLELPRMKSTKGYDLRLYKTLRFFSQATSSTSDSIIIFLRLLTDSNNYYQYSRVQYMDGWDTLDVDFQNFYNLKLQGDTVSGNYSLKGNPTLMKISYIHLGVLNTNLEDFSGEVYFNDIILREANTDMGHNLDLTISSNIGDLISNLSYNIQRKSARYKSTLDALRDLGDRENISHNFNVKSNMGKFLNEFVNVPVSFNYKRTSQIPLYKRNSDILLPSEEKGNESSLSETKRIQFNLSRSEESKNWLIKYTIDRIRASGTYSIEESFYPEKSADTVINSSASINYNLPLPKISPPILSDNQASIIPANIRFNADYTHKMSDRYKYSVNDSTYKRTTVKPVRELNSSGGFSYRPIRWINISYNMSAKQDLLYGERFGENVLLREVLNMNHSSNQLDFNSINFSYSSAFSLNHSIDYSKTLGDTLDVRSVRQNRSINITDNLRFNQILKNIPILSKLSDNVSPIRFSSSFGRDASYAYINALPDYKFRYGVVSKPDNSYIVQSNPSDGGNINTQYNISSGINFGRINIDISGNWKELKPDDEKIRNSVSAEKVTTLSFPNANIQISNMDDYIPGLKNFLRSSKFNISINKDKNTTISLTGQNFKEEGSNLTISPNLDMKFKNNFGLNIRAGYSRSEKEMERTYEFITRAESYNIGVSGSYSITPSAKGLPIPFLGRVKWTTPITLKASFSLQNNKEVSINISTYNEEIRQDNRNITFSLSGNYDFSNMISGGLQINYKNYLNRRITNDVTTTYGAMFNIVFKF
jgi:hypothetical protein